MNNFVETNSFRFIAFVLLQALVLNHINFLGYINPYLYILFIILYPVKNNRMLFIFLCFLLGLSIDLFSDSAGVHATASVFLGFVRPVLLKSIFGALYEHQTIRFGTIDFIPKLIYISLMTLIHHFVLFLLEVFNVLKMDLIIQKTVVSSIFTIILCILVTFIFTKKNK